MSMQTKTCVSKVTVSIVVVLHSAIALATAEDIAGDVGATFYVDSQTGNDTNDGTSRVSAFRTFQRAVSALNRSGGDPLVLRGTFHETLSVPGINHPHGDKQKTPRRTLIRCDVSQEGEPIPAIIDGRIPPKAKSFPFDRQGKRPGFGPVQQVGHDGSFMRKVIPTSR